MPVEKLQKEVYSCSKCGACKVSFPETLCMPTCPQIEKFHFDAYYVGGWAYLARKLITGQIKLTPDLADLLYTCSMCGVCEEVCANDAPATEIMDEFRFDLVKAGFGPMPGHKEAAENISKTHNPYGESHDKRSAWLTDAVPSKAEVIYFVGSTAAYQTPEIAQGAVKVLNAAGVNFGILEDEWDSGELLFRTGQRDLAADVMKHNIEAIKNAGAKTVITSDPHAYVTFKRDYEMPDVQVIHTTQYFNDLIQAGKLTLKTTVQDKVTYHDPCNLGRKHRSLLLGYQVVEPPRDILKSLQAENVEMVRSKNWSWCCGAGGGIYWAFPDYSIWTGTERLKEAEKTGANTVVTACPLCKVNLTKAAQRMKSQMKIADINELIVQAI
jgi:heterodisulfide reductase subunit D